MGTTKRRRANAHGCALMLCALMAVRSWLCAHALCAHALWAHDPRMMTWGYVLVLYLYYFSAHAPRMMTWAFVRRMRRSMGHGEASEV